MICVWERTLLVEGFHGKQRHDIDVQWSPKTAHTGLIKGVTSEAAGLQLLVSQLQGHPGVEHGGPQFAPHQVIGQPEDLRRKLSGGLGGEDGGAAKTCREGNKGQARLLRWINSHVANNLRRKTGSATLTAWHTEGWPHILCTPVWSERWAVEDGIRRVSRHHRAEAVTPAGYCHKHSGHAVTWEEAFTYIMTWPHFFKKDKNPSAYVKKRLHTFIFGFDAECLIWAFVCWGDSQEAGNPVGGASLLDFFTVSHVWGGAHQNHHPAAGLGLQQQLDTQHGTR